ncbi:PTS glucitol/sorbitol transporter subunit IIA [Salinicoccus sp. ID82-1]|uniref:PTS glucose transporter subunit IIABC n=1 Tax=Salinicoccus cyprini TaxID=2493691 RepID=A0A558AS12_9STAP|nr:MULTISPECIES: PTS glucitol/sorbitol transporter subunit IIA [Salinicoccus]MCG1009552.1 PTS glucitol/sorbitol transporter subunit IIA [Salinicoccus sp. ID82-1]TVT26986.1 PTS glucose transporter subunit IIABC [Salinicoccus cyprini]
MEKLKSTIVELGKEWEMMKEGDMLILFNETAPQELKDIAVIHNGSGVTEPVAAGDYMHLGDTSFEILFVGDVANETLRDLGHATFNFNGESHSDLPGTVCLEKKEIPELREGQEIIIKNS